MSRLNGIHVRHNKNTENAETKQFPLPKRLTVLMSQAMGAPCTPTVKKGDEVKLGQVIGNTDAFMAAPIHSPASGKVAETVDYLLPSGARCKAVVIDTDGEQTVSDEVKPPVIGTREEFLAAVRASGCVGLGGAGFPTHVKFAFDPKKTPIDTLVINGAECEPYITSDYRCFMEEGEDVLEGVLLMLKYLGIPKCIIGIEKNKPKAIEKMTKLCEKHDNITVKALKSSYPQGAEKTLIFSTTGRVVKEGTLPLASGCIVVNSSTAAFIAQYIRTGMPLVKRRITVDGNIVKKPSNFIVPVGMSIGEIV